MRPALRHRRRHGRLLTDNGRALLGWAVLAAGLAFALWIYLAP